MFRLTVILLLVLAISTSIFAQELKIGVINSEIVVENYSEFRRAEGQLEREVKTIQTERATWEQQMMNVQKKIEDMEKKLASGQNIFTPERKSTMRTEIDSLKMDFQMQINQRSTQEQETFNLRRTELLAGVFEIVNKAIEELGEQEGYDFIIDSANGTVVYAKDPDDLTDKLLQYLDKK